MRRVAWCVLAMLALVGIAGSFDRAFNTVASLSADVFAKPAFTPTPTEPAARACLIPTLVRVRKLCLVPTWVRVRMVCLELTCVRLERMWLLLES